MWGLNLYFFQSLIDDCTCSMVTSAQLEMSLKVNSDGYVSCLLSTKQAVFHLIQEFYVRPSKA